MSWAVVDSGNIGCSQKLAADIACQVCFEHNQKFSYLPHEKELFHHTCYEFEVANGCLQNPRSSKHTISYPLVILEEVVKIIFNIHCNSPSICPNTNHKAMKQHYYSVTKDEDCKIWKHCHYCINAKTYLAPVPCQPIMSISIIE